MTKFYILFLGASIIILMMVLFVFVSSYKYRKDAYDYSFVRGASGDAGSQINFECPSGYNICLYRATEICTNPTSNNFEDTQYDSFNYDGSFNYNVAIDRTQLIKSMVNGKNKFTYYFNPSANTPSGICGGKKQLISSYACTNDMSQCKSY
ncbi:MAG TPA: hypothetical protein VLE02_02115 [Nitrosarchaeum sp.]|nr:hypothetical protein [Nitrosarchaeum sp.]